MERGRIVKDVERLTIVPLRCRPRLHEPGHSILQRLAARAGKTDVVEFLRTVPRCPTWLAAEVRRGRHLDAISVLSGIPLDLITRYTPVANSGGTFIRNVLLAPCERHLSPMPGRGRICPECLGQDREALLGPDEGRAHRRFWWDLPSVFGCPVHARPLLQHCPSCHGRLDWLRPRPDLCPCGQDLTRVDSGPAADASLDRLLVDMMLGRDRPSWVDGMSVQGIAGLALRVGVVDSLGPAQKEVTRIGLGARMDLAAAGAALLDDGPEAFGRVLDRSVAHPNARIDSPNRAYGELHRWLRRGVEPGMEPFRDLLLEHALRHLRCRREETMFGHALPVVVRQRLRQQVPPVAVRRASSRGIRVDPPTVASLADELGCSWERICSVASIANLGEFTASTRTAPVPAEVAELLRARLQLVAPTRDMQTVLGLSAPQFVKLLAVDDRDRIPKGNPGGADLFDIVSARSFLDTAGQAPCWSSPPEHLVPLMAVGRIKRRWPDVVKAVRDGRVGVAGVLTDRTGLQALLVDPDEVRASLPMPAPSVPTLSFYEAVNRLDLSAATVTALRRATILIYAPRHGFDRQTKGPTVASVEQFERDFVSARSLARELGRGVRWLSDTLACVGVLPVVSGGKDVQAVFRRAAADDALLDYRRDAA